MGCPFAKDYVSELELVEKYEPKLIKAAKSIFADSYEYTQRYMEYREKKKLQVKNAIPSC